ncbi:hypothetical protein CHS0354_021524 [Potamilus streckersoni]|uniref:Uncharacterized protein n=1 Tax=Potamilus streckersoni TaxID=2493646 RepID=A0AAE0SPF2_9BIVA|nr:hypothetical protein CHS0354_021524 [Potamilus streckersoni]
MTSPRVRFNLGDEEKKVERKLSHNLHPGQCLSEVRSARSPDREKGQTRQKRLNHSNENRLPIIQELDERPKKRGRVDLSSVPVISYGNIETGNKHCLNIVCENGTKQTSRKIQGNVKNSSLWNSSESHKSLNVAGNIISGRCEFQKDGRNSKLSFQCSREIKSQDGTHSDESKKQEIKKTQNKASEPRTLASDSGDSFNAYKSEISGEKETRKTKSKAKISTFCSVQSLEPYNGADSGIKRKHTETTQSKEKVSKMNGYDSLRTSQNVQSKYDQAQADTDIGKNKKPAKVRNHGNIKDCKTIELKPCICSNGGCVTCLIRRASKATTADIDKLLVKSILPHEFYDRYSRITRNRLANANQSVPEVIQICKPMTSSALVPHAVSPARPMSSPPAPPSSSLEGGSQEIGSEFVFSETDLKTSFDVTLETGSHKWDAHAQCKPKCNPLVQMDETTGTRVTIIRRPKRLVLRKVQNCTKSKHEEIIESPYAVESLGVTFCIPDYNHWMKRKQSNDQKLLPYLVEKLA